MTQDAILEATIQHIKNLGLRSSSTSGNIENLGETAAHATQQLGGTSRAADRAKRSVDEMAQSGIKSSEVTKKATFRTQEFGSGMESITSSMGGLAENIITTQRNFSTVGSVIVGTLIKDNILDKFKEFGVLGAAVSTIITTLTAGTHAYTSDLLSVREQLSSMGASFEGDILLIAKGFNDMLTDLPGLTRAIEKTSNAFAIAGGTVQQGANQFIQSINYLQTESDSLSGAHITYKQILNGLGISTSELMEIQSELMKNEVLTARTRNMTDSQRSEITMKYIMELDKLSKITGKTRKDLADEMSRKSMTAGMQSSLMDLSDEKQRSILFAHERAKTMGIQMQELFEATVRGIVPKTEGARILSGTKAGQEMISTVNDMLASSDAEVSKIYGQHLPKLSIAIKETTQAFKPLARLEEYIPSHFSEIFVGLASKDRQFDSMLNSYEKYVGRTVTATGDLTNALEYLVKTDQGTKTNIDGSIKSIGGEETQEMTDVATKIAVKVAKLQNKFIIEKFIPWYTATTSLLGNMIEAEAIGFPKPSLNDFLNNKINLDATSILSNQKDIKSLIRDQYNNINNEDINSSLSDFDINKLVEEKFKLKLSQVIDYHKEIGDFNKLGIDKYGLINPPERHGPEGYVSLNPTAEKTPLTEMEMVKLIKKESIKFDQSILNKRFEEESKLTKQVTMDVSTLKDDIANMNKTTTKIHDVMNKNATIFSENYRYRSRSEQIINKLKSNGSAVDAEAAQAE